MTEAYERFKKTLMSNNLGRAHIIMPEALMEDVKINAFQNGLKINEYILYLISTALDNIIIDNETIQNLYEPEDFEDLINFQFTLPNDVILSVKTISVQKQYKNFCAAQHRPNPLKKFSRLYVNLLYTGKMLEADK